MLASMVSRVSCGAPGWSLAMMRRIFASSSISPFLLCWRPAVSMIRKSAFRARAACTASYATAEGSAPDLDETIWAPVRSAQRFSCSAAAARKVSHAARTTFLPSPDHRCASFPAVVVFPLPFTPTMRIVVSPFCAIFSGRRSFSSISTRSSFATARMSSEPEIMPR